jgi:hypothetical protein
MKENISRFSANIIEKITFLKIQIIDFVYDYVEMENIIRKKSLTKWDLKFLTANHSLFVIKDFLFNDIGLFVVIENAVFNEIVKSYRKIHKNQFRQHIWCEMIQRVMRPDRLVKIAECYGYDLVEYMDLMGF